MTDFRAPKLRRMVTDLKKRTGKRIQRLRVANNITKSRFCLMVSISRPILDRIENGEENFTIDTLERIAAGLDVTPAELLQ